MKLGKFEIGTIIILLILLCCSVVEFKHRKSDNINKILIQNLYNSEGYEEIELPNNYKQIAQNYHILEDLYNTDKKVFFYTYEPLSPDKNKGEKFHKELTQKLENEKLNYEHVAYDNWKDKKANIEIKYGESSDKNATCTMDRGLPKDLRTIYDPIEECALNACIIDNPNKKIILMTKKIDYIIEVLKEFNDNNK